MVNVITGTGTMKKIDNLGGSCIIEDEEYKRAIKKPRRELFESLAKNMKIKL